MYTPREEPYHPNRFPPRKWMPVQTSHNSQSQRARDQYASTPFVNERLAFDRAGDEARARNGARPLLSCGEEGRTCRNSRFGDLPGGSQLQQHSRRPSDRCGPAQSWRPKPNANSPCAALAPSIRREFVGYRPRSPQSSRDERISRRRAPAQLYHDRPAAFDRYKEVPHWSTEFRGSPAHCDLAHARRLSPRHYESAGEARVKRPPAEDWATREGTSSGLPRRLQHNITHRTPPPSRHQYPTTAWGDHRSRTASKGANEVPPHHVPVRARRTDDGATDVRSPPGRNYRHPNTYSHYSLKPDVSRHQTTTSRHSCEINLSRESPVLQLGGRDRRDVQFPRNNNIENLYSNEFPQGGQIKTTRQAADPLQRRDNTSPPWNFRSHREARDCNDTPAPPVSATYAPAVARTEMSFVRQWEQERKSAETHLRRDSRLPAEQIRGRLNIDKIDNTIPVGQRARVTPSSVIGAHSPALALGCATVSTSSGATHPLVTCCVGAPAASVSPCAEVPVASVSPCAGAPAAAVSSFAGGPAAAVSSFAGAPAASVSTFVCASAASVVPYPGAPAASGSPCANAFAVHIRGVSGNNRSGVTSEIPLNIASSVRHPKQQNTNNPPVDILTEILAIGPATGIGVRKVSRGRIPQGVAAPRGAVKAENVPTPLKDAVATAIRPTPTDGTRPLQRGSPGGPPPKQASGACSAPGPQEVTATGASSRVTEPGISGSFAAPKKKQRAGILEPAAAAPAGGRKGGNKHAGVVRTTPVKDVSFASPVETRSEQSRPPKAARNFKVRKDVREPPIRRNGRSVGAKKKSAAAPVKAAGATTSSAKKGSCVPRRVVAKTSTKILKGKQKSPSPSSSSDSDTTGSSSSSSDSSSTSSLSSSDSDSSSSSSSASRKAPSNPAAGARARRCSPVISQPAKAQRTASSTSKGPELSTDQQKTSCTRSHLGHHEKASFPSVQRPTVATQTLKPKATLSQAGIPVIPKSTHAAVPHKSCKRRRETKSSQPDDGRLVQEAQASAATTNGAGNSSTRSTTPVTAKSTNTGGTKALLCLSKARPAVQYVLPKEAPLRQQQGEHGIGQEEKAVSSSHVQPGPNSATAEKLTKQLKPAALPRPSTLEVRTLNCVPDERVANSFVGPVKNADLSCKIAADEVQPRDAGAAPPKGKEDCEAVLAADKVQPFSAGAAPPEARQDCEQVTIAGTVHLPGAAAEPSKAHHDRELVLNDDGSTQQSVTLLAPRKENQNSGAEAGGVLLRHSPSSGVAGPVEDTVKAAAGRKSVKTGGDRTASASEFAVYPAAVVQPAAEHTSAQPAATTSVSTGAHRTASSDEVTTLLSVFTNAESPAFATGQAAVSLTPTPARAGPRSPATHSRDLAGCKPTRIDGPCACGLTPPGIVNLGKTCSVNALLQALSATRVFSEFCNDVCHQQLNVASFDASPIAARTAGRDATAPAVDPLEAKEVLTALLTPVEKHGDAAPAPPSYLGSPLACSYTHEHIIARDTGTDTLAGPAGVVDKNTNASKCAPHGQDCAAVASVEVISPDTAQAVHHCIQEENSGNAGLRGLNLSRSLAAILYQMCNGARLNSSSTGESPDTRRASVEAAATGHHQQQEQEDVRKQLRAFKQLRTNKWREQGDEGVLNPINFVTQVKLLNAEFQRETELDVEEIWRCIADRLLQEAGDECRRLTLLLKDASSNANQRLEPESSWSDGNGERHGTKLPISGTQGDGEKEQGRSLTDSKVTSFTQPRCSKNAPVECMSSGILASPLPHGTGMAKSSSVADESGVDSTNEAQLLSLSLMSKDHLVEEHGGATDARSTTGAEGFEKIIADVKETLQQTGNTTETPQGPEREQDTVGLDGATHCVVDIGYNNHMTTGPATNSPLGKVSAKGQGGEHAYIPQNVIQTQLALPEQENRCRLRKSGQSVLGESTNRSGSPCTPSDTSKFEQCVDKKVKGNCQLATNLLEYASSSPQPNSSNEQGPNCLRADGRKMQIPVDRIACSLRAAQTLHRRLQNALTGRLVHVPVACGCCCPCNRVTVSGENISNPSVSLSHESDKITSAPPLLFRVTSLSSSSSNIDQLSNPSLITTANPGFHGNTRAGDRGGRLRGGNERRVESDSSSRGTCETCTGVPASRASNADDGDSDTGDVCAKKRVEGATGQVSSKKKKRRRILITESDSEFEACDRHSVAERGAAKRACPSVVAEGAAVAAAADLDRGEVLVTETSHATHPSEGQGVSESPKNVTSRTYACNNQANTPNGAINNSVALGSRNDMLTETHQSGERRCHRLHDALLTLAPTSTAPHNPRLFPSSGSYLPLSKSQDLAFVCNAAFSATADSFCARSSTKILKSSVSLTKSVVSHSSTLPLPAGGVEFVGPSTSALTAQEELFSAALALRLPERSRWTASRSQGARNRLQAGGAQGKQGPITLDECLNLALEHKCNGESALTAAQKTAARSREGRDRVVQGKKGNQAGSRQQNLKTRKDRRDDINGLVLCNECGHFSRQPDNASGADAKASTSSESDVLNQEALLSTCPGRKEAHVSRIDDPPPKTEDILQLSCAAVPVAQGKPTSESDMSDEGFGHTKSKNQLRCFYCDRTHTKTYFEQLPRLLVLQLHRSSPAEISARQASRAAARAFTGGGVKIKAHVQFPLELQEDSLPCWINQDQAVQFCTVHHRTPVAAQVAEEGRCSEAIDGASCTTLDPPPLLSEGHCQPCTSGLPASPFRTLALAARSCSQREAPCTVKSGGNVQPGASVHQANSPATLQRGKRVFKLRAVIEHQGRTGTSGHYVCFRRGFNCRTLKQTSAQRSLTPVSAAPNFCTSGNALQSASPHCQTAALSSTANAKAAAASPSVVPAAAANSNSVQACRPSDPTSLEPPCSAAVTRVSVDEMRFADECGAACVAHSHQLTARPQEGKKIVETPNRMPALGKCQQETQTSRMGPSANNKRLRDETQQLAPFTGERQPEILASEVSARASESIGRKRHCTDSARSSGPERASPCAGESDVALESSLHSQASTSCASREGLLGGIPLVAAGERSTRRRKKGEADPAEMHYLEEEDWWEANDSQATRTTWQRVSLCQAYLLVYELEEQAQAMCEKQHSGTSLQAEKLELKEGKKDVPLMTVEEQTNRRVTEGDSVKGKTSTSRWSPGNRSDKTTAPAVDTGRAGRGRKRARSAPTNDEASTCMNNRLEPAKRRKRN